MGRGSSSAGGALLVAGGGAALLSGSGGTTVHRCDTDDTSMYCRMSRAVRPAGAPPLHCSSASATANALAAGMEISKPSSPV